MPLSVYEDHHRFFIEKNTKLNSYEQNYLSRNNALSIGILL